MLTATRTIFLDPLTRLIGDAMAAGHLVAGDAEATARAMVRLIYAEGAAIGIRPQEEPTPDDWSPYAHFLVRLLTRGLLPRPD